MEIAETGYGAVPQSYLIADIVIGNFASPEKGKVKSPEKGKKSIHNFVKRKGQRNECFRTKEKMTLL